MNQSPVSTRDLPRHSRGVILTMLTVGSMMLVVWTVYLGWRLPKVYVSQHWRLAWVGLDALEILALLATTWSAYRRRVILVIFATAASAMFIIDAWFDVTTARSGDVHQSLVTAALVEVPAALVLFLVALLTLQRVVQGRHQLAQEPVPLWRLEIPYPEGDQRVVIRSVPAPDPTSTA